MTVRSDLSTETVLDRVCDQHDRLYDLQAMIAGALCMDNGPPADLRRRLLRQASQMLDDVINRLDTVELQRVSEASDD